MTPLLDALHQLDSRLDVGLSIADYTRYVGDASVAYDQIDFAGLAEDVGNPCVLTVGLPAEQAINLYIKAQNKWQGCIERFGCALDDIESNLQTKWAKATVKIDEADEALALLEP